MMRQMALAGLLVLVSILNSAAVDPLKSLDIVTKEAMGMSEAELAHQVQQHDEALLAVQKKLTQQRTAIREMAIEDLLSQNGEKVKKRLHALKHERSNLSERRSIYSSGLR